MLQIESMSIDELQEDIENKYNITLHKDKSFDGKPRLIGHVSKFEMVSLRIGRYDPSHKHGIKYVGVGYDHLKEHHGSSRPCDDMKEVYSFLDKYLQRKDYEQIKLW